MASIQKHGKKWRAQISKNGQRTSKVFDTKQQAQSWALSKEVKLEQTFVNSSRALFSTIVDEYVYKVSINKKGYRWEKVRAGTLKSSFLGDLRITEISPQHVAKFRDDRLLLVKASSVNRDLNFLSSIFQYALTELQIVSANPVRAIKRPKNPKHRDRRISASEEMAICDALGFKGKIDNKSHEVAVMFLLALETAMRRGELANLRKADVFLNQQFLSIVDTKNGDKRDVALSTRAVDLLSLQMSSHDDNEVFTVGADVCTTLFRKAVKAAEIDDLTLHDSRHEAITRLAQKLDVLDLARMIGHRDPRSLMIYYNPTASEIAKRLG